MSININKLLQTIQTQNQQINHLKGVISKGGQIDFQAKYKKALRDISGVVKANRQLKDQLDQLKNTQANASRSHYQIQHQQFQKAYQKLLQEKNQLALDNQNLQFEKEKMKYSVSQLEEYVAQLKSQNMSIARQKQAIQIKLTKLSRELNKKSGIIEMDQNSKKQIQALKQKQKEYNRALQSYEQHHISLNKMNRQLQQRILEVQSKLHHNEAKFNSLEQNKNAQVQFARAQIRKQLSEQMNDLKRQNFTLKNQINGLQLKNQSKEIQKPNDYQTDLINAIQDLQVRMEPMKNQIQEIKTKNENDRQEIARQKAHLKMKNIQLESQIQIKDETVKNLQKRLIKSQEEVRKAKQQEKLLKKLEQQNRMLGGRVIVLESKDVALRNRSAEDLQQRVIQFQNRVRILLNDKENLSSIKNVSIHQLIALKAYILELDSKIKSLVNENEYSSKKYKSYKEKYHNTVKSYKSHQSVIASYKSKILGYDKLILKMQAELKRAIEVQDIKIHSYGIRGHQQMINVEEYKRIVNSMKQKLELQEKYKRQEIQTLKLNYDTKLIEANIKLEEFNSLQETIKLYKQKNNDLGSKLIKKESQLIELRMQKDRFNSHALQETGNAQNHNQRDLISTLQLRISEKDAAIVRMELQIRNTEQQWRKRFSQLEMENNRLRQSNQKPNSPKINIRETNIFQMEQDIRKYRSRIAELQNQLMVGNMKKSHRQDDSKQRELSNKISRLQFDLEEASYKITSFENQKRNYEQKIESLELEIRNLQSSLSNQRIQFKQKIQQHIQLLNRKDQQLRNQYGRISTQSEITLRLTELQNLNHRYALEIEHLNQQLNKSARASQIISNRDSELSIKYENLNFKYEMSSQQKRGLQLALSRLQVRLRTVEQKLRDKQNQLQRTKAEYRHLKIQIDQSNSHTTRDSQYESNIQNLNNTITNLNQQIYRLTQENYFFVQQLKRKDKEIYYLKDEIDRFRLSGDSNKINNLVQIERLSKQNYSIKDEIQHLRNNLNQSHNQIKYLNETINNLERQLTAEKARKPNSEYEMLSIDSLAKILTNQNIRLKADLEEAHNRINELEKQNILAKTEINKINILKDENQRIKRLLEQHKDTIQTLRTKILSLESRDQILSETANIDQLHFLKEQIRKFQKINIELRNELNIGRTQLGRIRQLEQQVHELRVSLQRAQININTYKSEIQHLNIRIQEKQQIILRGNQNLEITSLRQQCAALLNDNQHMHRLVIDRDSEIHYLRQQIQSMSSIEVETQMVRFKAEIDFLQIQIEGKNKTIQEKDQEISIHAKLSQELKLQLSALKEKEPIVVQKIINDNNKQQIKQLQSLILRMQQDLQILVDDLQKMRSLNQQKDLEIRNLQSQLKNYEHSIKELRMNLDDCERDLSAAQDRYTLYRYQIDQRGNADQNNIKILLQEKANLQKIIQQTEGLLIDRDLIINQRNKQIEALMAQNRRLSSKSSPVKQENSYQNQQLTFIIRKLQDELSLRQAQDLEIRGQLEKTRLIIQEKDLELVYLGQKIGKLQVLVAQKDQLIAQRNTQNLNKATESQALRKRIQELYQHIQSLQRGTSDQQNMVSKQRLREANQLINSLNSQIEDLRFTITSLEGSITDKQETINMLSGELRQAKLTVSTHEIIGKEQNDNSNFGNEYMVRQLNRLNIIISQNERIIAQKELIIKNQERTLEQQNLMWQKQVYELKKDFQELARNRGRPSHSPKNDIANLQQIKRGLRAYQSEIERLNKIISESEDDSKFLRLKLAQMTSQQNRISQNLQVMVLSFAQIEALRDRLQLKQNEITDVRNSLIQISRKQAQSFKIQSRFIEEGGFQKSNIIERIEAPDINTFNVQSITSTQQIEKRIKQRSRSLNKLQQLKSKIFAPTDRSMVQSRSTNLHQFSGSQVQYGGKTSSYLSNYHQIKPSLYDSKYLTQPIRTFHPFSSQPLVTHPIGVNFSFKKPSNFNLNTTQYSGSQRSGSVVFSSGNGTNNMYNQGNSTRQVVNLQSQGDGSRYRINYQPHYYGK